MALSLAKIIIFGLLFDWLFRKIYILGLIGMLLVGVIFGPCVLNWLNHDLLAISAEVSGHIFVLWAVT
ncbi:MAG: hypothetical protein V1872_02890 [bacterium]